MRSRTLGDKILQVVTIKPFATKKLNPIQKEVLTLAKAQLVNVSIHYKYIE